MMIGGAAVAAAAAVPNYRFHIPPTRVLSPTWIQAIRRKLIQITISHPGHRYQSRAIAYARAMGLTQPYIDNVINLAPNLAQQLQALLQLTGRSQGNQHTQIGHARQRRVACIVDIDMVRIEIGLGNTCLCMQRVGVPQGQPNNPVYIPLYGIDNNNHELNRVMAQVNIELNPFYLPNMLENMAHFTHRASEFVYNDGGHVYHTQASARLIDHDLNCIPVEVTNRAQNGPLPNQYPGNSDFMNGNWIGNDLLVLAHLNETNLLSPPPLALRQFISSSWIVINEIIPQVVVIQQRIHIDRYGEEVVDLCRNNRYYWEGNGLSYLNRNQGLQAIMPSNWQHWRYIISQPQHHDWQVREGQRTQHVGHEIDRYNDVRTAYPNAEHRAIVMRNNLLLGPVQGLSHGNYRGGTYAYGCIDLGRSFAWYHHKDEARQQHFDPGNPHGAEHGHGFTLHCILNSDAREVHAIPTSYFMNIRGMKYVVRWRMPPPTNATFQFVRGHASAPFSGATFIAYGSDYCPTPTETYTLRILQAGHNINFDQ